MAADKENFEPPDKLPWPEKGEKLFVSSDDWWHNACLNYLGDDWQLYVVGYKRAAEILVDQIKRTKTEHDSLVFPIVFLYRQYLELRLKQIIRDGFRLLDDSREFPKIHELDKLWQICKIVLDKIEPKASQDDIEAVDEAISQFCTLDPSSEGFRYPTKRSGERSLPADLQYINLRHLADVMGKLTNFFDTAEEIISVYLGYKSEMESQW